MTHQLKALLGNDHPLFASNILSLEKASGNAGIDVRLLADITERGGEVLRMLSLDPSNSTGEEVYHALINLSKNEAVHRQLKDTDFVIMQFGEDLVSFNILDVIENAHHELAFNERTLAHAQRHLRAQIIKRYAQHERTHEDFVHKVAEEIGLKPHEDEGHHEAHGPVTSEATVLAIGDIFSDAFIELSPDSARVDEQEDGTKRISIPWGSREPYEKVEIIKAVGPSPNAAVSISRLGVRTGLMAFLGDDQAGDEALENLKKEGIDTGTMSVQKGIATNYYYVLRMGAERTLLIRNEDYDYKWQTPSYTPDWIYLAETSPRSWDLHMDLLKYLDEHHDTKLAFQPGSFHFKWGVEKLKNVYKRAHIVIMNREEAMKVTGKSHDSIRTLAIALHELGPQIVVITDGPDGSYASYDFKLVTIPNYPDPAPPLDRTGAGDSFASTIVAALAMGEPMDTALTWAPINSMSVVQQLGAQKGLLSLDKLKEYLAQAPEEYKLTPVED
jgi:ribokinase